ncbi:hypothetical protein KIH39_18815 [Telmatocola sphagniphila]|jgi:hypothetical protein|uniref:Uncharacterized protein n=1 Tax=Telmatocola sphagniphila TaxID=1123043 RepID=A0A8E6B5I6_9BACT|nr:hypothetical protein [Telmatocola sphagniphila]QVL30888.1 hypothetical protein KIH39_18815 [Telmatocola sphagniphila]
MRKFLAVVVALMLAVGGIFAEEIKGAIFKEYKDGKATFTIEEKEKSFKVDPKAKIKMKSKGGEETEIELTKLFEKAKKDSKYTITVDGDNLTEAKRERKKN